MTGKKILIIFFIATAILLLGLFFLPKNILDDKKSVGHIENKKIDAPFGMPPIAVPEFPENNCNIKNYGAIGDGVFINTQPIKKAIEDCYQKGGGKVIFPKGKWLTGPIHFKSNINLKLDENSEIIFTTNLDDYLPVVFSKFQGMEYYNFSPPIYAKDCENIALTGSGRISGNGDFWEKWAKNDNTEIQREKLFEMSKAGVPAKERIFGTKDSGLRPSFIQFINCKNILIEDLTIGNGPMWTVHPIYSENIIVRKVNIETHSANTDGIVIDSSKNIFIEDSNFSTGDDSIAIKSGLEDEGIRINRPSENIVIENCNFSSGHGAVAIGSEMSGGVRNVFVTNSLFDGTDSGLRIKSTGSRGGFIENIWFDGVRVKNLTDEAIAINLNYKTSLKTTGLSREPVLRNIYVRNINGESMNRAMSIIGLPEGVMENILFENLNLISEAQSGIKYVKNIEFKNISLKTNSRNSVFQIENGQNVKLSNFKCESIGTLCLNIKGDKTSGIDLSTSGIGKDKISIEEKIKEKVRLE